MATMIGTWSGHGARRVAAGGARAHGAERPDRADQRRPGRDPDHRRGDDRLARAGGAGGERARRQRHVRAAAVRDRRGDRDRADDRAGSRPHAAMRCASPDGPSARACGSRWRSALPASLLLWHIAPLLHLLRQDPALIAGAEAYVRAAMWGFVPALWFVVLRNFIASLERPRAGMVITLVGVSLNAHRRLRPDLRPPRPAGARACGRRDRRRADQRLPVRQSARLRPDRPAVPPLSRFSATSGGPDWARFREIFRIGLPIGVTLVMEVGLFAGAGFLMGLIGTAELAAHQIALQCASVTFMVPLGLAPGGDRARRAGGRRRPCARASCAPASRRW